VRNTKQDHLTAEHLRSKTSPTQSQSSNVEKPPLVTQPELINPVDPQYPVDPVHHPEGTVIVEATVTAEGTVSNVELVQSVYPSYDNSVVEAVKKWRYKAGTVNGKPSEMKVRIPMTFKLDRGE
jgi:protein TonB